MMGGRADVGIPILQLKKKKNSLEQEVMTSRSQQGSLSSCSINLIFFLKIELLDQEILSTKCVLMLSGHMTKSLAEPFGQEGK